MKGLEKIKITKPLTIEEAFELLQKETFELGEPELYTVLGQTGIQFPPRGGYKIVISVTKKAISITNTYDGAKGVAKESGLDLITNGWSTIFGGSKGKKQVEADIVQLAEDFKRIFADYI